MTPRLAYCLIFIGVLGHASSEFFAVLTRLSGPEVSVWRFMLGSAGLICAVLVTSQTAKLLPPLRQDLQPLMIASLIGVTGTYLAFHLALDYASIVQVGTLVTTIPIFVGLLDFALNKQRPSTPKILTGLAAFAGVALLLTDGYIARLAGDTRSLTGIGLAALCGFCGAIYVVLGKPLIARYGNLPIITLSTIIGTAGLWLIAGLGWSIWVNPVTLFDKDPATVWPLLTLGIWNTTIAQLAWIGGLAIVPDMTRGAYLFFLKPVITALLAYWFLSHALTGWQIAAIIVICGAVLCEVIWSKRIRTDARIATLK